LSQSPIHKALSILRKHRVRALLMGGQACILYGAAEFSRDIDLAVLADQKNLSRLQAALSELKAEPVFVPPLSTDVLLRGHACHFRCAMPGTEGLRIDVMSVLHGCESSAPTRSRIVFWLREVRTSELLIELCRRYAGMARKLGSTRPALRPALRGDRTAVDRALEAEQERYRASDRRYWKALRAELARWRQSRIRP
jgi:hypothetical protein